MRKRVAVVVPHAEASDASAATHGVGLLVKAFQVLDLYTREQPSWSQAELQKATGLSRSTLSRLVRFLHGRGYLAAVARTSRYTLGFAAVDLGRRAGRESDLVELCAPILKRIAETTGETVMLTTYDARRGQAICLEQIPSVQEGLKVYERIGAAFPLYRGASPKAILAFLAPAEIESALAVMRRDAPDIDVARLRRDLRSIRASGLATSLEETYPGVAGFAVPVLAQGDVPLGSIAVAAPIIRMSPAARARIGRILLESGATLSGSLRSAA
ncbi:MAG: IclR family transcriptional regulator [Caldimonas sp.]